MFNEYGGFLFYPLRCSQITLSPFLLFEQGLTDKFPKPSFRFLNNSTGIFPKIGIPSFWRNFCWLRSEVFRRHLLWRRIAWKNKETVLFFLKRNLHSLVVLLLIRGGSPCLFLRQTRVHAAMLLPVIFSSHTFQNDVYYNRKWATKRLKSPVFRKKMAAT